jgi:hypothetical protein
LSIVFKGLPVLCDGTSSPIIELTENAIIPTRGGVAHLRKVVIELSLFFRRLAGDISYEKRRA